MANISYVSLSEIAMRKYLAEVALAKAEADLYGIKVEQLYGMKKPRFYGAPPVAAPPVAAPPVAAPPVAAAPKKCASCGSQEFILRGTRHICSYCRQ